MNISYSKPFQTYQELIQLLKSRGMIFNNENKAENILRHVNYYRLGGYWLSFEEDHQTHKFKQNTQFENVLALYSFDQKLKLFLSSAIEKIEVSVRANWAYQLAKKYDSHPHLNTNLFFNLNTHNKKELKEQNENKRNYYDNLCSLIKEINRSDEVFIQHQLQNYKEVLPPVWVICEVMSFGLLSKWFKSLNSISLKDEIARAYKIEGKVLESWLSHLRIIRNISAHHSRLWDIDFRTTPMLNKSGSLKDQLIPNSRKIYNSLIILLYLVDIISPKDLFRDKLKDLLLENRQNLLQMGFPDDWENKLVWQAL